MEVSKRIEKVCKKKEYIQNDLILARLGSKQTVANIWHGKQLPNYKFIEGLLKHIPDLNARWLILGEGTMFNSDQRSIVNYANNSNLRDMNANMNSTVSESGEIYKLKLDALTKEVRDKEEIIELLKEQIALLKKK